MKAGKWSLIRREDGGFSLYEKVSVTRENAESNVATVERGRFDIQVFWLAVAMVGKTIWLMRDVVRWLLRRKKRQGGHR